MSAAQRDKGAAAKVCAHCGRKGLLGYRVNRNGATVCARADVCRRRRSNAATPRLSDDAYAARLEAQGGGCALCGTKPKNRRLAIDHDHRTGEVRGLLCHRCNRALPTWVDAEWLAAASGYLGGLRVSGPATTQDAERVWAVFVQRGGRGSRKPITTGLTFEEAAERVHELRSDARVKGWAYTERWKVEDGN